MELRPISFKDACTFTNKFHRHLKSPIGHKFSISLFHENILIGVIMVGRPISRILDDGYTLECNRLTTTGTRNACSKLYSAAISAAKFLGYRKIITYILTTESGSSLRAAGFRQKNTTTHLSWDCPSRERKSILPNILKIRFEYIIKN
jgi:hypothetical protein